MEEKEVLLTQEGFDKLEQELDSLKTTKRAEIAERIKIALGFGDLSENSEDYLVDLGNYSIFVALKKIMGG